MWRRGHLLRAPVGSLVSLFTHSGSCNIDLWVIGTRNCLESEVLPKLLKAPPVRSCCEACSVPRLHFEDSVCKSLTARSDTMACNLFKIEVILKANTLPINLERTNKSVFSKHNYLNNYQSECSSIIHVLSICISARAVSDYCCYGPVGI